MLNTCQLNYLNVHIVLVMTNNFKMIHYFFFLCNTPHPQEEVKDKNKHDEGVADDGKVCYNPVDVLSCTSQRKLAITKKRYLGKEQLFGPFLYGINFRWVT